MSYLGTWKRYSSLINDAINIILTAFIDVFLMIKTHHSEIKNTLDNGHPQ
ncbi:hypothetical Protein YC6258_01170 [Gynuella sunshinyii YC6258]|uniref:Uncharacterized protein n=1 Tax=Gynuella sunshinyii YC6258 TaxID=1445510 RepID=A0A0C5VIQ3_9GAMM|nr:hypothetical Protein YC6258_01170 [Gynuella sunshinyii YC6258]